MDPSLENKKDILEILQDLDRLEALKELFSTLNYDPVRNPLSRKGWTETARDALAEDPLLWASGGEDNAFHIIYARLASERLFLGYERPVVAKLLQDHPYTLFIFSNAKRDRWHFLNVKLDEKGGKRHLFRRITIGPEEMLRTASERVAMLDLESVSPDLFGLSPLAVQARHDEAFDVEKIGKDFFVGYRSHFWDFVDAIRDANKGKAHFMEQKGEENLHRFTQLLMGRILFLYFIQKKGWLNNNRAFLHDLFKPYRNSDGYVFYSDCLESLFFNGLNSPGKNKRIGGKKFEIPYLNGGLFEPRETFFEGDALKHPLIPDKRFEAFFDFLGGYNFTVSESTPLDQDVDIDPEMLGKVFENLLEKKDRHASGTYYTPRTIVEFMCRESLFYHLHSEQRIEREIFNELFDAPLEGRPPNVGSDLAREVRSRLREIKVLDPAVGSGAFLLGMLHELVHLRSVCGGLLGESDAVQAGRLGEWKREMIGNNLFGVDNNPEACEIARLRLWLSMVVDEAAPSPLPNLDYRIVEGNTLREKLDGEAILPPHTGPGFEKEHDLFQTEKPQGALFMRDRDKRTASIIQHLATYYQTHADVEKQGLRKSIAEDFTAILEDHWQQHEQEWKRKQGQILEKVLKAGKERSDMPRDLSSKLVEADDHLKRVRSEREAFQRSGTWPVTPLRLFFAEAFAGNPGGFDIVIANPPYVRQELIRPLKPYLKEEFGSFFTSTADLYTYFYARGLDLLQPGGMLCFIAQNKFMRAGYGKKTRQLLISGAVPRLILDFGDLPIFEATTYPSILLIEKRTASENDQAVAAVFDDSRQIEDVSQTIREIGFPMVIKSLSADGWILERSEVLKLMAKLREKGVPLGKYVKGRFYRGILTGFNKAFVIDAAIRNRLIREDPKSKEVIKPWLRGRDIKKWRAEWAGLYVIFTRRGIDIKRYPAIERYLEQFKEDLMPKTFEGQKKGRKPGPYEWYEIQDNIAYYAEFEKPKIVMCRFMKSPLFCFENGKKYFNDANYFLNVGDKYVLAFLLSSVGWELLTKMGTDLSGGFYQLFINMMEKLPIFPATNKQKAPIIDRVEAILKDPHGPDISRLEKEIDALVFDLYRLGKDEIALISGNNQ